MSGRYIKGVCLVCGRCPEGGVFKVSERLLTVEYFESSWNLKNLELECGPAQPDLLIISMTIFGN